MFGCYRLAMLAKKARRPFTVLLALALSLGLVMHSAPGSMATAKAANITAGMPMDMTEIGRAHV